MTFWRNDYPRDILIAVNALRESPPRLTTPHVYVVMFTDLKSRSRPKLGVLKVLFDPDAANELAMDHFKERFKLWFIETCAFENWFRGRDDPGVFSFVVNWDLLGGQGVSLHASTRSPKDRKLYQLGSVWVEYHPIQ